MENTINPATVAIIKLMLFFKTSIKTLTNLTIFLKRAFHSDRKDLNQEKLEEVSWTIDYSFVDFYLEVLGDLIYDIIILKKSSRKIFPYNF